MPRDDKISTRAMNLIYSAMESEIPDHELDMTICAIVGEWKFYEDYKLAGTLQFLK